MATPILYETHLHTPLCKHASGEPEAYAAVAARRGLRGIIVTCHNPGPNGFSPQVRMALNQLDDYVAMVDRARRAWQGRVDVQLGLECDFLPELTPFLQELLRRADFQYVLGSVHPQLPYYRERYDEGDARHYFRTYFQNLALAAESGLFHALAHPDLVKNVYYRQWDPARLLPEIRQALDRIAATGVAMELNTSGLNKVVREMNPGPLILAEMRARDIPVVLGADAHEPERVAADYEPALDVLTAAGYESVVYFLGETRHQVPIAAARESLR